MVSTAKDLARITCLGIIGIIFTGGRRNNTSRKIKTVSLQPEVPRSIPSKKRFDN